MATVGSGYGYGSGSGDGDVLPRAVAMVAQNPDPRTLALWKSGADGRPCNGGSGEPARPGLVQTITGPLELCKNALHATLKPEKWKGERVWLVALDGEIVGDAKKLGATRREILAEII